MERVVRHGHRLPREVGEGSSSLEMWHQGARSVGMGGGLGILGGFSSLHGFVILKADTTPGSGEGAVMEEQSRQTERNGKGSRPRSLSLNSGLSTK